jgi:NADH-quinone oxidoreductase subunit C
VSVTPAAAASHIRDAFGIEPVVADRLVTVPLSRDRWREFARYARETLGCIYLSWLSAIDWKDEGLEVVCRVDNLETGLGVMMRLRLGAGEVHCPSLVPVWKGADWMEREAYDMFGVVFDEHPDLRRILLADDWVGHPLRKDWVDTGYTPYR